MKKAELRCKTCKKIFTLKKNLLQHQRTVHEKRKKYECGICQKRFSRKSHKDMHIRICSRRVSRPVTKEIVVGNTSVVKKTAESADGGSVTLPVIEQKKKKKKSTVLGMTREMWEKSQNIERRIPKLKFTPVLRQSAFGGCFAD